MTINDSSSLRTGSGQGKGCGHSVVVQLNIFFAKLMSRVDTLADVQASLELASCHLNVIVPTFCSACGNDTAINRNSKKCCVVP